MNSISKISKNPLVVGIICLIFLLFSCGREQARVSVKFSGRDYLRGILFMDGPVVNYIPLLRELKLSAWVEDEETLQKARVKIGHLLDYLEEQNPGITDEFKQKMTSGDYIRIYPLCGSVYG